MDVGIKKTACSPPRREARLNAKHLKHNDKDSLCAGASTPTKGILDEIEALVEVAPSGARVVNCYPEILVAIVEKALAEREEEMVERIKQISMTTDKRVEKWEEEFDEKFAKIVHVHRGECAITDTTGTRFQAHTENGLVTEVGGLESIKDFIRTILTQYHQDMMKDKNNII